MATREIVELPDKHTGDINEIRDKKIALASEASGATDITAQCEYLIKNGQTGEFMNVLKSYIDESVRSALGALVNNLDKGSSIKSVLATDSSNDLGSITPANLASVLGGHIDANKIRFLSYTIYNGTGKASGMPYEYGVRYHFGGSYSGPQENERAYFELFASGNQHLYVKISFNGTSGWITIV